MEFDGQATRGQAAPENTCRFFPQERQTPLGQTWSVVILEPNASSVQNEANFSTAGPSANGDCICRLDPV